MDGPSLLVTPITVQSARQNNRSLRKQNCVIFVYRLELLLSTVETTSRPNSSRVSMGQGRASHHNYIFK